MCDRVLRVFRGLFLFLAVVSLVSLAPGELAEEPATAESAEASSEQAADTDAETDNGPEMRFGTLEDVYGDSGNSFQGAIGFYNVQGTPAQAVPANGYGIGLDDMVVQWKEFQPRKDTTSCTPIADASGGSCAAVEIDTSNLYEGGVALGVSIVEEYPYDPVNFKNDCNDDGDYTDPGDDTDCNDNGILDIVAIGTSESLDREIVVCDQDADHPTVYRGTITISVTYDVPGVLFLSTSGTALPSANIQYLDRDDGTGSACPSSVDPSLEGVISEFTTVFIPRGNIVMAGYHIEDHSDPACSGGAGANGCTANCCGDGDEFPDTNEIIDLYMSVQNKTDRALSDVVVRVSTNSDNVDCILQPFFSVGSLTELGTAGDTALAGPFTFKVANVSRSSLGEAFGASFNVTIASATFDAVTHPQELPLEMDLDSSGGGSTEAWTAGFESGGGQNPLGGKFIQQDLDAGKQTLELSDGWRCQYNDPDFANGNSYREDQCFLGFTATANNTNDWHKHTKSDPDDGRARSGSSSLHYGYHSGSAPNDDTMKMKQLDGAVVEDDEIINVGTVGAPKLEFWHQISFMDSRGSSTPAGEAADRAVVHLQLHDAANSSIGDWIKIYPFENVYDVQGTDQFSNCLFDPTDDGNDEDSFFSDDPTETTGPSSTCFPEFVFGFQGDTDWQKFYSQERVGRATDAAADPTLSTGLGDAGFAGTGPGTWVKTSFDLSRFRGRRIKLRFVATTIELGTTVDYLAAGFPGNSSFEDGWYIDDVEIAEAITSPATLSVDTKTNATIPGCGAPCGYITPVLEVDPTSLDGPGQVVELSAVSSTADRCTDGTLQFQFWNNSGASTTVLSLADGDVLMKDWSDNPVFIDSPIVDTTYGVNIRCSSDPTCTTQTDEAVLSRLVTVACPDNSVTVTGATAFGLNLTWNTKNQITWENTILTVDLLRGDLLNLRSTGNYTTSVLSCPADSQLASSWNVGSPTAGQAWFFLVRREDTFCNEDAGSYSTKAASEQGSTPFSGSARDVGLNAASTPPACGVTP